MSSPSRTPAGETRFLFVTGGVVSALGKGIAAASIGRLLVSRGFRVQLQKFDPYINVDPGTMSPFQHGEVFVTEDGAEADLDLGHYERYTGENSSRASNVTAGAVYNSVIKKERRGDYLGGTVQVIPHITDEIKQRILIVAEAQSVDFVITEIGGTVGDIESLPFLEAIRQLYTDLGPKRCMFLHLTLVPYVGHAGELKTKPTQHSINELRRIGIQPHAVICRSEGGLDREIRRKIALFGSDSDPRAFNFDGEFNVANRGIIEFIEVLKLDVAFLYDLLGASQEHSIKPKKFPQTDIDEVIIGHTNEPEYRRLQNNEYMEALRDRTVKVDIPYITKLAEEIKIYEKDYNKAKIRGKHIAPHTIEMASMWAVLTRLEDPKKHNLTLMQKLKLYSGKTLPGFTEDNVKELRKESRREGMEGISPRYIQDKISNALVSDLNQRCVNPFMVLNELESGLRHHSLVTSEEQRQRCRELLDEVRREYEDIVKNEVQRAIAADEAAISRLCGNYVDNVKAYTQKERVRNPYTGQDEEPDERLMRSIEEKIDIPDSRKDDFRREIMNYIGALALEGRKFDYRTNERLHKALELKLFEDQKDTIKLTSLVSSVVDQETQEKIDIVKGRLVRDYGYCESCASDVLHFVASIFARGDVKEQE